MTDQATKVRSELHPEVMDSITAYDDFVVPAFARPFGATILEALGDPGSGPVVDLGCGSGATARQVHAAWPGACVVGVDAQAEALAVAASRSPAELAWSRADACWLPFPDASLGAVVAQQVVQFVDDYQALADEVSRALRPGGRFVALSWTAGGNPVLATLDDIVVSSGLQAEPRWKRARSFDKPAFLRAASYSGLEVVAEKQVSAAFDVDDRRAFVYCFIPDPGDIGSLARGWARDALSAPMRLDADLLVFACLEETDSPPRQ